MLPFLLKLTICWGFFALLYGLVLRRETFFRANRAYLIGTVALGILLALPVDWPAVWRVEYVLPASVLPAVTIGMEQAANSAEHRGWLICFWMVYGIGTGLALLRMMWGLFRIIRMVSKGKVERLADGCILIETDEAQVPFSFFKWLFVPQKYIASDEEHALHAMLAHERAHAHDWHSIDVLLVEMMCVVFWFHPLAHWYRRAIRTVHEYLADAEASRLTDKKQYGLLLIRQAQSGVSLAFVNHFFQSPLKQRLIMLTRNASPALRAWKYGLFLPVFVFLFLLACQKTDQELADNKITDQAVPSRPETGTDVHDLFDLEQAPQFPGGKDALVHFLSENIRYPETARRDSAQGTIVVGFVIDENGKITDVGKTEGAHPAWRQDFMNEAIRAIERMPDWTPGRKNGKPVKVTFSLPIHFKLR